MNEPVQVIFPVEESNLSDLAVSEERIWCLPISSKVFAVDNIPFYAIDISLGDEIEADTSSDQLRFRNVLRPSKNTTIRAFAKQPSNQAKLLQKMQSFGGLIEKMEGSSLIAISFPPSADLASALAYLDSEADKGQVAFEESAVRYR